MEEIALREAVDEGLTTQQLADRFGFASTGPLRYWMRKYSLRTIRADNPSFLRKFSDVELAEAVASVTSVSGVLRYLGQQSGSHSYMTRRIRNLNLDTSHFRRMPEGYKSPKRKPVTDILVFLPDDAIRTTRLYLHRALQEMDVPYECVVCGNAGEWLGELLDLEIDHLDGDWRNNLIENLRYLCPNCHSQTPTFRNKKRN